MRINPAWLPSVFVGLCVIACGGGSGGLQLQTAASTPAAVQAMREGRAVAVLGDYPAMAYVARESAGRLSVVGEPFGKAPYGIAVSKDAPGLQTLVAHTLHGLILNGGYQRILETWALEGGAIRSIEPPAAVPQLAEVAQLADGTLTVGLEIAHAPMEFLDEANQEAGVDVELARALGQAMGIQVELKNVAFDALLPQLESGEIDLAMSSITVTAERSQRVDFIPYFETGSGILVPSANPAGIQRPRDLCDHAVAVQSGTVHVEILRRSCQ